MRPAELLRLICAAREELRRGADVMSFHRRQEHMLAADERLAQAERLLRERATDPTV
jgi:hypothetical protein